MIWIDGILRAETDEEIAERLAEQNRQKLAEMQSLTISRDGLIDYLLSQINITLPDGTTTTGAEAADQEIPVAPKIGYKLEQIAGANGMAWQYVVDPDAVGTADNPIMYYEVCPRIDNAFYIKDGTRYVCMSGELVEF